MDTLALAAVAFVTSTVTAVLGVGGGVLLISVMPGFVPAATIVPLHGIVQVASNLSRAAFAAAAIERRIVGLYAVGAVVGAAAGSRIVPRLAAEWTLPLLGAFVLLVTWLPRPAGGIRLPGAFVSLGAVQTFVSLFVGAAGPLSPPVLLRAGLSRDALVATHAALMTVLHVAKAVVFGLLGFAFAPWLPTLAAMIAAVTLGSWVGTRLRHRVPQERFRRWLRIVLTILGLRLLLGVAV